VTPVLGLPELLTPTASVACKTVEIEMRIPTNIQQSSEAYSYSLQVRNDIGVFIWLEACSMAVSSDGSTATCTFDTSELKAAPFNLKWSSDINYQVVGRNSEGQVFSPTGTNPVIVERCSQEINLTNVSTLA
jgi:hypothetical protein